MGLDHGHTCSTIDGHIQYFTETLKSHLSDLLDEVNPYFQGETKTNVIQEHVDNIYNDSLGIFEDVRKCNEDMRQQADLQIDDLEREKDDLESEVDDKQTRIEELEYDLGVVEDRCADLEAENKILQDEEV